MRSGSTPAPAPKRSSVIWSVSLRAGGGGRPRRLLLQELLAECARDGDNVERSPWACAASHVRLLLFGHVVLLKVGLRLTRLLA